MHPEKGPAVEHTEGPEECGLFVAGEVGDAVKALLQVGVGGDAVGHLAVVEQWVRANEKHPETYVSRCCFLVGAGGFEPPKLKAADLQSVPIGHSGTRPYSFVCPAGRLVYFSMEGWICQHFSANFCKRFSRPGSGQKSPVGARKKGTRRGLKAHAFFLQISENQ